MGQVYIYPLVANTKFLFIPHTQPPVPTITRSTTDGANMKKDIPPGTKTLPSGIGSGIALTNFCLTPPFNFS